jgi:hypothetical protein
MSTHIDARMLELVSKKLKEANDLLVKFGYDDWSENLLHIKTEIDEEAKSLNEVKTA